MTLPPSQRLWAWWSYTGKEVGKGNIGLRPNQMHSAIANPFDHAKMMRMLLCRT